MDKKKKIIILAGTVLIQALVSFLLILFVFKPNDSSGDSEEKEDVVQVDKTTIGEIYLMEDIVVNPSGTRGRRFISLSIGFELNPKQNPEEIKKREPKIMDVILLLLSKKGLHEFINIQNREVIRHEILEAIQEIIPKDLIKQVYITKFIIQ